MCRGFGLGVEISLLEIYGRYRANRVCKKKLVA